METSISLVLFINFTRKWKCKKTVVPSLQVKINLKPPFFVMAFLRTGRCDKKRTETIEKAPCVKSRLKWTLLSLWLVLILNSSADYRVSHHNFWWFNKAKQKHFLTIFTSMNNKLKLRIQLSTYRSVLSWYRVERWFGSYWWLWGWRGNTKGNTIEWRGITKSIQSRVRILRNKYNSLISALTRLK